MLVGREDCAHSLFFISEELFRDPFICGGLFCSCSSPVFTVCRLVLEWNALGLWAEAFSLFCEGLASNTALTQLDLLNNQINHDSASQLAQALARNSSLEALGDVKAKCFVSLSSLLCFPLQTEL